MNEAEAAQELREVAAEVVDSQEGQAGFLLGTAVIWMAELGQTKERILRQTEFFYDTLTAMQESGTA